MQNQSDHLLIRRIKEDERILWIFLSVLGFSLLAHFFRYTNNAFNADSLGIFRGSIDITRNVARGRWLQPVFLFFRGSVNAPYLNGLLATFFLSISIMLMVKILDIRNHLSIVMLCGLLTVAPSITITNAAFIPSSDIFMVSLLFSMISGYCLTAAAGKFRYLISGIFLIMSLAIYQAYIGACMLICLLWLVKKCIRGEKKKKIVKSAACMLLTFVLSLVLYYVSFRVTCAAFDIVPSDSYNSVASAAVLTEPSGLPVLLIDVYKNVLSYMIRPEYFHSRLAGCINICLLFISGVFLCFSVRNKDIGRILIILLLVIMCPPGAYFIYLLSGINDTLLTFPIVMLYLGGGMLYELASAEADGRLIRMLSKAAFTLASVLIFFGIVYANQVYLKKSVEELQTLSLMTRVMYHMEQTEGYSPGNTKVAIVGSLQDSEVIFTKQGYDAIEGRTISDETSISYYNNYRMYLNNIMGYPISLVDQSDAEAIALRPEVGAMPAFPHSGCTMMLDDILVVKLSEP